MEREWDEWQVKVKEMNAHEDRIQRLIPEDKEEFKKIFRIKDSEVDYYKKELATLLCIAFPDLTWDEETKEVILKELGTVKGLNILDLFSEVMYLSDWLIYTMWGEDEIMVEEIKKYYIGEAKIEKLVKEKYEKLKENSLAKKFENFWEGKKEAKKMYCERRSQVAKELSLLTTKNGAN